MSDQIENHGVFPSLTSNIAISNKKLMPPYLAGEGT